MNHLSLPTIHWEMVVPASIQRAQHALLLLPSLVKMELRARLVVDTPPLAKLPWPLVAGAREASLNMLAVIQLEANARAARLSLRSPCASSSQPPGGMAQ